MNELVEDILSVIVVIVGFIITSPFWIGLLRQWLVSVILLLPFRILILILKSITKLLEWIIDKYETWRNKPMKSIDRLW